MSNRKITIKRIYEDPAKEDGFRVLIDRIWPRGVSKDDAKLDEWMKDIAPSTELRKWFDHDPDKFNDFKERYKRELDNHEEGLNRLINKSKRENITLLYGAKDEQHNHAIILKDYLEDQLKSLNSN